MVENEMTHWLRHDFRFNSLFEIISGIDHAICVLKNRMREVSWYDGLWFLEESESIYGLAFIAFQNYINGCISDFTGTTSGKIKFYQIEPKFRHFEKSSIELIIGLANYSKHKDDNELHKSTKDILESFGLILDGNIEIDKSALFVGLTILNDKWDLFEVLKIVKNWREKLWSDEK